VAVHDPLVATPTATFDDAVTGADVVIVATNHSVFSGTETLGQIVERAGASCLVVDPWNALGAAQVFAYANEIAALRA
jgi:UDP-N-acetyl-D-mannosaminuronic acid dehydrogenase